jgi:hypothetical protein
MWLPPPLLRARVRRDVATHPCGHRTCTWSQRSTRLPGSRLRRDAGVRADACRRAALGDIECRRERRDFGEIRHSRSDTPFWKSARRFVPAARPSLSRGVPTSSAHPTPLPPGSLSSAHAQKTFARKKVDNTCPSVLPTRHRHASVHDVARELADRPHRAICTRR